MLNSFFVSMKLGKNLRQIGVFMRNFKVCSWIGKL